MKEAPMNPNETSTAYSRATRRELLIGASSTLLVPAAARAQTSPSWPLRVIAAGRAGVTADLVARLITEPPARELGQTTIVEHQARCGRRHRRQRPDAVAARWPYAAGGSELAGQRDPAHRQAAHRHAKRTSPDHRTGARRPGAGGPPGFSAKNLAGLVTYV
jgi:hypothetical protein